MNDFELRKFYSAQRIYRKRQADQQTPSGECTWREWFLRKYGEALSEYADRAKREGLRQQVEST